MRHLVIIPTKGETPYLNRAIESCKSFGLEYMVVDASVAGNIPQSLNYAVQNSDADTYSMIGADDEWIASPQPIYDAFSGKDVLWAYAPIDIPGGEMGEKLYSFEEMKSGNKIPGVSMFMRRSLLLEHPYDENFLMAQDFELSLRLLSKGITPAHINQKMVKYNVTGGNLGMSELAVKESEQIKQLYK